MNKLYGAVIIFFHFVKYPIVILLPVIYLGFDYPPNIILDSLWLISGILILTDKLYGKQKECSLKRKGNIISNVVSLQIGKIRTIQDESMKEGQWSTGSFKEPVANIRDVSFNGIEGDEVSDLVHHGGEHKAVFANSFLNYPKWEKYLEVDKLEFGALAENLTLDNIAEEDVCIGDIHKIGTTTLEVSQPREPCWKISKKHKNKTFTKEIYDSGRTGWYYRVLEEGQIKSGDNVEFLRRIKNPINILQANKILKDPSLDINMANALLNLEVLGKPFKKNLKKKIDNLN